MPLVAVPGSRTLQSRNPSEDMVVPHAHAEERKEPLDADPTNSPGYRQRSCPGSLRNGDVLADGNTDIRTDGVADIRTDCVPGVLTDTDKHFGGWDTLPDPDAHLIRTTFRRVW